MVDNEEMLRLFEREPAEEGEGPCAEGGRSVWFFPLPRTLGDQQEMGGAAGLCWRLMWVWPWLVFGVGGKPEKEGVVACWEDVAK